MNFPKKEKVEIIKKTYQTGDTIICDYMDDPNPVPSGTKGTVTSVDDIGQIHVQWENGQSLALNEDVDKFHKE